MSVSAFDALDDVLVVDANEFDLVADITCPLLVLPCVPAPDGDPPRNEIVVPLAGGEVPRPAVRAAMKTAEREHGAVVVIQLYRGPESDESVGAVVACETRQTELLDLQLATMRPPHVPVITEVVREDLGTAFRRVADRTLYLVVDRAAAAGPVRPLVDAALTTYGIAVLIVPS